MIPNLKPYPAYKDSGVEWLGQVPEHWEVKPVKRHYAIQLGKMLQTRPNRPDDIEVPYLKAQHIQWFSVRTSDAPRMWASPRDIQQFGITAGDLLVCEGGEGGRCGIVKEIPDGFIIQNALHRVRPRDHCSNDYLQYVMSVIAATDWFEALNNKATIAHFTREKFVALCIPIPEPDEQTAIVRFLDWAERRIRRVIRARRRRIKLLEEYKQALIHQAVTGRIDVRTGKPYPAYKDSGVPWLGEVPEHWEVRRLRTVVEMRVSNVDKHSRGGEKPVRLCNYVDVYKHDKIRADMNFMRATASDEEIERFRLQPGDVLITKDSEMWNDIAVPALVETAAPDLISGYHLALLRPRQVIQGAFLFRAIQSPRIACQFHVEANGVTRFGLSHDAIKSTLVPLPPLPEQTAIVEYLDAQTAKIDAAIAADRKAIDLLQEFRTRLIADVVTGKLDVREAAANLPDEPEEEEELIMDEGTNEEGKALAGADLEAMTEEA